MKLALGLTKIPGGVLASPSRYNSWSTILEKVATCADRWNTFMAIEAEVGTEPPRNLALQTRKHRFYLVECRQLAPHSSCKSFARVWAKLLQGGKSYAMPFRIPKTSSPCPLVLMDASLTFCDNSLDVQLSFILSKLCTESVSHAWHKEREKVYRC